MTAPVEHHPPTEPFSPAFAADPYPTYAWLREHSPVHRVSAEGMAPFWLVSRHHDVVDALRDGRLVNDPTGAMTPEERERNPAVPEALGLVWHNVLTTDPPDHTRLRRLVQAAFTPGYVAGLRPRVQEIVDDLLERAAGEGSVDLVEGYGAPLAVTVIAEVLGVPAHDHDRFRGWAVAVNSMDPTDPGSLAATVPRLEEFAGYLADLVAARRSSPREDLTSALVRAQGGDEASLSGSELLSMLFVLLVAGHDTTVNLISDGALALLEHPDQLELLRARPDLVGGAVEELLRHDGPVVHSSFRWAREDLVLGGVEVARGDGVLLSLASADRDPEAFERPDDLDITRRARSHLAFGHGIHRCLGAPLARLEAEVALLGLVQRFPGLRLAGPVETLRWRPGVILRGPEHLPVLVTDGVPAGVGPDAAPS